MSPNAINHFPVSFVLYDRLHEAVAAAQASGESFSSLDPQTGTKSTVGQ